MTAAPLVVLVTGGRDCDRADLVAAVLDERLATSLDHLRLIQGGARGADELAAQWGHRMWRAGRIVAVQSFPVSAEDRRAYGKGAFLRRNQAMVDHAAEYVRNGGPAECLAFPQGSRGWPSRGGTADCVRRARAAGLRVGVVGDDGVVVWDPVDPVAGSRA